MCFNTFIQFIKQEKYEQLGFSSHDATDRLYKPILWFQLADDAAVVTTDERENQLLLHCFTKWCQWANMIVRVDKSKHFLPDLTLLGECQANLSSFWIRN